MVRGTTPTLEFTLPFDTSLLTAAFITLAQSGRVIIDKSLADCTCSGQTLTLVLTQEETLKFDTRHSTEIQVRVKTAEGNALASRIITENTYNILKDGVI